MIAPKREIVALQKIIKELSKARRLAYDIAYLPHFSHWQELRDIDQNLNCIKSLYVAKLDEKIRNTKE